MAKFELTAVHNARVESVKADKEYENGSLVGLGGLEEGELRLYKAAEATNDNVYVVSTPEYHTGNVSKGLSIDFTNVSGDVMRVHHLDVGDAVTVEQKLHNSGLTAGQAVGVEGGKFAVLEEGKFIVDAVLTIGVDRRPAYLIRRQK